MFVLPKKVRIGKNVGSLLQKAFLLGLIATAGKISLKDVTNSSWKPVEIAHLADWGSMNTQISYLKRSSCLNCFTVLPNHHVFCHEKKGKSKGSSTDCYPWKAQHKFIRIGPKTQIICSRVFFWFGIHFWRVVFRVLYGVRKCKPRYKMPALLAEFCLAGGILVLSWSSIALSSFVTYLQVYSYIFWSGQWSLFMCLSYKVRWLLICH